jgi:hypothetical protein
MDSFPPSLELDFQPLLTGVFSSAAQKNPTAPMVEAACKHPGIYARYLTWRAGVPLKPSATSSRKEGKPRD